MLVIQKERKTSPKGAPVYAGRRASIYVPVIRDISLECMLEDVQGYMCSPGHPGRISMIPENLRELDIKSYVPCFLSIGPYHHGKISLRQMDKKNWVVFKWFLEQKPEVLVKHLLKDIKCIEPAARSFYTDVKMETNKIVQRLLLDSLSSCPVLWNDKNTVDETENSPMKMEDESNDEMSGES